MTAYPENGPFRSRQLVPLQCTISPTPPFPVKYIWKSSTPKHYPETSFPSSTPITTVTINENHPLQGRYFCHVLSASNYTTLAVGHVDIQVEGKLFTRSCMCKTNWHYFCYDCKLIKELKYHFTQLSFITPKG